MTTHTVNPVYGMAAEFDTPEKLLEAANKVREAGYRRCDAFAQIGRAHV